ncbi:MAG: toprim domain-containing protein [Verrucomicrobia bacterium]|nr:toprim domain-containing protein [Verrucomicrobiota bacterium]
MPMIPDDEIDRIKHQTDLAAVIRARGVELKPQGHDLVGLCPFHEDHDPSLRVTPRKGLWRCMSCGATGNVIQFVQRFDGVSFRHAYELLKNGAAFTGAPTCQPVKKGTVPRLPAPVAVDADDQAALRQVLDYYHERLKQNPVALAYLQKRGIAAEAVDTFRLGFVDRTLGLRLPQANRKEGAAIRERLQRLGILRDTGHEHLRGRVVFPVIGESGAIGTVYGRAIDDGGKHDRHLFLPGPQRGIWNPAALRSSELILTEGIIDALTFWSVGYRNVTTGYSAKALPDDLLDAILAAKILRVLIAFDRDEAGDKGAAEVAAQLAAHGVECARVQFPHGQDANAYALAVTPAEKSLGLLLRSAVPVESTGKLPSRTPAPVPSSIAAKAASEAAERVPTPEKTSEPVTPTTEPEKAAKEEMPDVAATTARAPDAAASAGPGAAPLVTRDEPDEIELAIGDRRYRVRGLGKNTGFESLRVSLRVACAERWHLDTLDLCSARQRQGFIEAAAMETTLKPELLKRDLGKVLGKLEELQEARLKAQVEAKPETARPMPQEERDAALALLRDPKLLDRILADFTACGVVGEQTNKLVGYLAAVSRKLDQPLAVIVQSTSAAGKTALMEAVLAFVPPEDRVKYSALTGQALYYLSDADLKHKILAIVEEEGAERASYALKLLQSEGELTIASTGKDPHTGRMVTQEYRVEGPVMIFLTTTAVDIDEELLNRCLVLTVDEGREQTAAIHRMQRERETLAGLLRKESRSQVLATHRAAQRLLRPLAVVNPYAEKLTFLDDRTRTRRDHTKYLALIRTIALLHQYQRPVRTVQHGGKSLAYVEATLDDIAAANRLAHEVLGRCLDEMPPQTRRLLALLEKMVAEACAARKAERSDVLFTRRQVRDFTGWGDTQLKIHLGRLAELEYVLTHRADYGQGFVYELVYDGAGKDGGRFLPGLLDTEKLRAGMTTDPQRSGVNGERSAPGRPVVGGQSAGGRAPESPRSSSENAVAVPDVATNAHLETTGQHAAA